MVFSSVSFLFYFFPIFLAVYYVIPWRNLVLLAGSLLFYAWGEPRFVLVLIAYIVVNYAIALLIERPSWRPKFWVTVGIFLNLALLFYFKYFNFFSAQVSWLEVHLGRASLAPTHILLPLGISFVTFQGISYLIDVFRGQFLAQRSLLKFAMYKSMFPQLIAGPIVRYGDVAQNIAVPDRPLSLDRMVIGIKYFMVGCVQKVLIASILALPADQIFSLSGQDLSFVTAWCGIICYSLQIYFDFAGYSNMAIGLGHLLGFNYPQNFNRPYISTNLTEFWRRWHMTLSRWLRDYLYLPLGGNRLGAGRTYLNLATVFILCGLWHGANWTFLFWGAYHGVVLIAERLLKSRMPSFPRIFRHMYLLLVVMLGWVLFRSENLSQTSYFVKALFGFGNRQALFPLSRFLSPSIGVALVLGSVFSVWNFDDLRRFASRVFLRSESYLGIAENMLLFSSFVIALLNVAGGAYNPFIYFRF